MDIHFVLTALPAKPQPLKTTSAWIVQLESIVSKQQENAQIAPLGILMAKLVLAHVSLCAVPAPTLRAETLSA